VRYAVALLRDGTTPPREILTRVELIDRLNVASFAKRGADTPASRDNP
jgi:hypothetical protein